MNERSNPPVSRKLNNEAGSRPEGVAPFLVALIIGLIGVAFISYFVHWFENFVHGGMPQVIIFSITPISFFLLFLVIVFINPVLHYVFPKVCLGKRELAIILCMWLFTGAICYRNLITSVVTNIGHAMNPILHSSAMRDANIVSHQRPDIFLPEEATRDFYYGKSVDRISRIRPFSRSPLLRSEDFRNLDGFARRLTASEAPFSTRLRESMSDELIIALETLIEVGGAAEETLIRELNRVIDGDLIFDVETLTMIGLSDRLVRDVAAHIEIPSEEEGAVARLNRLILDEIFPTELMRFQEDTPPQLSPKDIRNRLALAERLSGGDRESTRKLFALFLTASRRAVEDYARSAKDTTARLIDELNALLKGSCLLDDIPAGQVALSEPAALLINRLFLARAYPDEIIPSPSPVNWPLRKAEIADAPGLAVRLNRPDDPVSAHTRNRLNQTPEKAAELDRFIELKERFGIEGRRLREAERYGETADWLARALPENLSRVLRARKLDERGADLEPVLTPAGMTAGRYIFTENVLLLARVYPEHISYDDPLDGPVIADSTAFSLVLGRGEDPLARYLFEQLPGSVRRRISSLADSIEALEVPRAEEAELSEFVALYRNLPALLAGALNDAIKQKTFYSRERFAGVDMPRRQMILINRTILVGNYSDEIISLPASVPWGLWARPLLFWIPLMLAIILLSYSLVRMMHHQWSRNELLSFPIADIAEGLVNKEKKRALPDVFYNTSFWLGFAIVGMIYLINGLHAWFPQMIQIPLEFEQRELVREFPFLANYAGTEAYALFRGWAWPMVIGIAVLLPTDVSLTCWLANVLMIFGIGFYFLTTGEIVSRGDQATIRHGMYIAMFAVILFIGRREYARILKLAFTSRLKKANQLAPAVNGCRFFIISFIVIVGLFMYAGMNWFMAVFLVFMFSIIVILIARTTAEVGFPWLVTFTRQPTLLTQAFFGSAVIGPAALALMAVVGLSVNLDTSNSVAAQATTIDMLEEKTEKGRRKGAGLKAAILVTVIVAIGATTFFTLWSHYSFGAQTEVGIRNTFVGQLNDAASEINMLRIEGISERLDDMGPLARFGFMRFESRFWRFFAYGAGVVLFCAFMRLRFTWWPIHPLPLLMVNTWGLGRLYHSYMLGWFIKMAILRIWGGEFYHRSKPFFYGVILAHIVLGGLWIAIGSIYYSNTGMRPPNWRFFS